jgi:two-component system sensor histidine kinase SenX3
VTALAIVLAAAAGAAGLAVGIAAGLAIGRRRSTSVPALPAMSRQVSDVLRPQPLASLVVEALEQGVVVVDHSDRAILVNPSGRAMAVLDVDQLAFPELLALARTARERGESITRHVDLPIGRLGREPIALAVTAVPLAGDDAGSADAIALLLADVSEQRRLEAVRRDFVANVSHELKTPVGALSRLGRLVGELMELSRVQGVDPMPGAAEVDVESLIVESADRSRLAAEQAGIDVAVECERGLIVRGNEAQLVTAVANLVDNAVAYSPTGTRVVVHAQVGTDHQSRHTVDISVTDQGLGIAEADLDRIFERFYRVDPARSRATGGTGLGLAIVKNIVTNHLGTVSVRSVVGSGSTFTVRLPRVHPDTSPSAVDGIGGVHRPARHDEGNVMLDASANGSLEESATG